MSALTETILSWRAGQLTGTQLMRSVVSHPHWMVPLTEAAAAEVLEHHELSRFRYYRDPHGVNHLMLWSSRETFDLYASRAALKQEMHCIDPPGAWVFRLPLRNALDGMDRIWIDPLNEHDILYDKDQFGALRDFAAAVAVEEDLAATRAGTAKEGTVVRIREYQGYLVAVAHKPTGAESLILAPDGQGRSLAAVFTHSDAFDAFLSQAKTRAAGDELRCVPLGGKALFTMLSKMDLTGVVFNCAGPVRPVAFAAGLSKVVLEA